MQQHSTALSEINTKAIYFTIPFVWHSRKGKNKHIVQELGTEEENWMQRKLWEKLYMEMFYMLIMMVVA